MANLPFMPVATDAILSDAGDLPNVLFGAYCRLLFRWWREGAAPEPNERRLARWAGLSSTEFEDLKEFLTQTEAGWVQKRLMESYARAVQKSENARKSAFARKNVANAQRTLSDRSTFSANSQQDYAEMSDRSANAHDLPANAQRSLAKTGANAELTITMNHKKNARRRARGENYGEKKEGVLAIPDHPDPECADAWNELRKHLPSKSLSSWFVVSGSPALRKEGERFVIEADGLRRDRISQQFATTLNSILGKQGWSFWPPPSGDQDVPCETIPKAGEND